MLLVERRVPIRRLEAGLAPLSAWLETADLVVDALLGHRPAASHRGSNGGGFGNGAR